MRLDESNTLGPSQCYIPFLPNVKGKSALDPIWPRMKRRIGHWARNPCARHQVPMAYIRRLWNDWGVPNRFQIKGHHCIFPLPYNSDIIKLASPLLSEIIRDIRSVGTDDVIKSWIIHTDPLKTVATVQPQFFFFFGGGEGHSPDLRWPGSEISRKWAIRMYE